MKIIFLLFLFLPGAILSAQPAPQLTLGANGSRDLELPKGWPLVVKLVVMHSQRLSRAPGVPQLRMAPAGMTWADAIRLQVTRADGGETRPWDLTLPAAPEDPVLLLPNRSTVGVLWRMSPEATAALETGTYRLAASLEIKDSDGWNGAVQSGFATIRVVDERAPLTPEDESRKQRLRAQYALAGGDVDEAERALDELLKTQPDNVPCLRSKAEVLEQKGDIVSAYLSVARAMKAVRERNPGAVEQPEDLFALWNRLRGRLLSGE